MTSFLVAVAALSWTLRGPAVETSIHDPAGASRLTPAVGPRISHLVARGDDSWQRRASPEGEPDPRAVAAAVATYGEAVELAPEEPEARWKLLRAIYFQGLFVIPEADGSGRRALWERGRDLAEASIDRLAEPVGGRDEMDPLSPAEKAELLRHHPAGAHQAAEVLFWSALHWGQWSDSVGRIKAARQGVGKHLRDLAETVVSLDPRAEAAGGHRFLGRLHAVAPKIPFFTGWVDRDLAIEHLRRAVELAPEEPENSFFLAEALLDHRPRQRAEALEILRHLLERRPRADHRAEDGRTLERIRRRLAEEGS